MKKCLGPTRRAILRMCACAILGPPPSASRASTNFLKARHEYLLAQARLGVNVAMTGTERALALRRMAEELDALSMPVAALRIINLAMRESGAVAIGRLRRTKARVLFSLGHPEQALALLGSGADEYPPVASSQPGWPLASFPGDLLQALLTAVFSCMQLGRWRDAIAALANLSLHAAGAPAAYRSVIYRYIMARAGSPRLADAGLEREAAYHARHDNTGYGLVLRLWAGADTSSEVGRFMKGVDDAGQQEMLGRILFYMGAYLRYVRGNAEAGRSMLQNLNNVAPYGCIEWEYGRTVLS